MSNINIHIFSFHITNRAFFEKEGIFSLISCNNTPSESDPGGKDPGQIDTLTPENNIPLVVVRANEDEDAIKQKDKTKNKIIKRRKPQETKHYREFKEKRKIKKP